MDQQAFHRLVDLAGGTQRALADRFKVTEAAVTAWKRDGIPPGRAREAEILFTGRITREELLPGFFGPLNYTKPPGSLAQSEIHAPGGPKRGAA